MKILKNNTLSDILISDTGVNILSNNIYTIPPTDYALFASSSDIVTYIGSGDIVVNDGTFDLSKADGMALLQGNFKQLDFIDDLKNNNRLQVEVLNTGGPIIQVSSNDQTTGYLEQKITGTSNKIIVTTINEGVDEDLQINIGNDVFDKAVNTTDNIIEGSSNLFFTNERAQDAIGAALVDSSSIDFTYNDAGNSITASVLPAGVDHNSLANLTTGDPHTQYVKDAGTVTDNAIVRYDTTDGRTIQNSLALVGDSGEIISPSYIRVGTTSNATPGNISYNATFSEILGQFDTNLTVMGINPTILGSPTDVSTTSSTYASISGVSTTPSAGSYLVIFNCEYSIGEDTNGDIALFVNNTEQTLTTRNLSIDAVTLFGATATNGGSLCIISTVSLNGSTPISIRFRENGGGTLKVGSRQLILIPYRR